MPSPSSPFCNHRHHYYVITVITAITITAITIIFTNFIIAITVSTSVGSFSLARGMLKWSRENRDLLFSFWTFRAPSNFLSEHWTLQWTLPALQMKPWTLWAPPTSYFLFLHNSICNLALTTITDLKSVNFLLRSGLLWIVLHWTLHCSTNIRVWFGTFGICVCICISICICICICIRVVLQCWH